MNLKNENGSVLVGFLIGIMVFSILVSVGFVLYGIYHRHDTAEDALRSALVSAEKADLNLHYSSLIEGESYDSSEDYADNRYEESFYDALQKSFSHVERQDNGGSVTYTVRDQGGEYAFTLQDVAISITVQNKTMADGKTKRLVYQATGTLIIPVRAFRYSTDIQVPVRAAATYQCTG